MALAAPTAMGGSLAAYAQTVPSVHTDDVCFTVHNQGDPVSSDVYGVRYSVGVPGPETKVIVLVHGFSVTHAFWDVRPEFSVARRLAEAGYVVIAYDRLGYGKSPYTRPGGAYTLSWSGHRAMLHEIVAQVKAGRYRFSSDGACSGSKGSVVGVASATVILIGHSGGGWIVSGYPGTYHDVAAVVQAGTSNFGLSDAGTRYIATKVVPQLASGDDHVTLAPTVEDCKQSLLYVPGVVPSLLPTFCQSPSIARAPAGELMSAFSPTTPAENLVAIRRVGPGLPVLLAYMDNDFFWPSDKQAAETEYWVANCGCDVQSWTQTGTGHAFVAHSSMPTFTSKVVAWLASKGLGAE